MEERDGEPYMLRFVWVFFFFLKPNPAYTVIQTELRKERENICKRESNHLDNPC